MKFIDFEYVDRNNKVSNREALVLNNPTDKMACIDVSELEADEQAQFAAAYNKALEEFQTALMKIYQEYDVVNNYREFVPERMKINFSEYI